MWDPIFSRLCPRDSVLLLKVALGLLRYAQKEVLALNDFQTIATFLHHSLPKKPVADLHKVLTEVCGHHRDLPKLYSSAFVGPNGPFPNTSFP